MNFNEIFSALKQHENKENAEKMSAYMKHLFPFLGIPSPLRREISKKFLREGKKQPVDWQFIKDCWACEFRELQYVALDYLHQMQKELSPDDIPALTDLVLQKSWWDSVDNLDRIIGRIAFSYPQLNEMLLQWSVSENIWLRRVAIDHQLLRKGDTDTILLAKIIENNFGQTEFFINKAIGWSLRDYAKTNPQWVKDFVEKHQHKMAKLSIREAMKHL